MGDHLRVAAVRLVEPVVVSDAGPPSSRSPRPLLDTRDETGRSGVRGPIPGGTSVDLTVVGVGGVPATGVQAVTLTSRPPTAPPPTAT